MTPLSWAETRKILDAHSQSMQQVYANCDALKDAIGGVVTEGTLISPVVAQAQQFFALSFIGRLRWLLTGRVV